MHSAGGNARFMFSLYASRAARMAAEGVVQSAVPNIRRLCRPLLDSAHRRDRKADLN